MKRAVKCLARNGSYVDDSSCTTPTSSKPAPSRVCQMKPCKWENLSSSVDIGKQYVQTPNVVLVPWSLMPGGNLVAQSVSQSGYERSGK